MQVAHFKNIRGHILDQIIKAKDEVLIAMAWFTNEELFDSLLSCLERGVKVELILLDNAINWYPYAPDFSRFISKGGHFHVAPAENGLMHNKFCIVDNEIVITGSYNWTYYAESRNMENIIIVKNQEITHSYTSEFNRLKSVLKLSKTAPKLAWEDIEQIERLDFEELNFEIESYATQYQKMQRKVYKSNTTVQVVEKRLDPKAAYTIGMQANYDGDENYMYPIIKKGVKLPYTDSVKLYSYADSRDELACNLYYGDIPKASDNTEIIKSKINQIIEGSNEDKLTILVEITLNSNGYLHIEIKCQETGKAIDLTTTNIKLVEYGE